MGCNTLKVNKNCLGYLAFLVSFFVSSCNSSVSSDETPQTENPPTSEETPKEPEIVPEETPLAPKTLVTLIQSENAKATVKSVKVGDEISCDVDSEIAEQSGVTVETKWYLSPREVGPFTEIKTPSQRIRVTSAFAHSYLSCRSSASKIMNSQESPLAANDDSSIVTVAGEFSIAVAVINSSPVDFRSFLSSDEYFSGDSLTCSGTTTDPDGDGLTYRYRVVKLKRDEPQLRPEANLTVPSLATLSNELFVMGPWVSSGETYNVPSDLRGHYIFCESEAKDQFGKTALGISEPAQIKNLSPDPFASIVINRGGGNRIDIGSDLSLPVSNLSARVGDRLECSGVTTDVEDLDNITYKYTWYSPGTLDPFSGAVSERIKLTEGRFYTVEASDAHKSIQCIITATDTLLGATESFGQSIAIENTPPLKFKTFTSTPTAIVGNTVQCVFQARDMDNDQMSYTFQWYSGSSASSIDLAPIIGANSHSYLITVNDARRYLTCEVGANDGQASDKRISDINGYTFVLNTKPNLFKPDVTDLGEITFLPNGLTPVINETVYCTGSTTDLEDENLFYTYRWALAPTSSGPFVFLSGQTSRQLAITTSYAHKYVRCEMVADDLFGGLTLSDYSNAVLIKNVAPESFTPQLDRTETFVGDQISCFGTTTDRDLDQLSYEVVYYKKALPELLLYNPLTSPDLIEVQRGESRDLSVTPALAHYELSCEILANDGFLGVTSSGISSAVSVINNDPSDFSTNMDAASDLFVTGTVSCRATAFDIDSDLLTYSVKYFKSDTPVGPFSEFTADAEIAALSGSFSPVTATSINQEFSHSLYIGKSLSRSYIYCQVSVEDPYFGTKIGEASEIKYVQNSNPEAFIVDLREEETDPSDSPIMMVRVGEGVLCRYQTSDRDNDQVSYTTHWLLSDNLEGPFFPWPTPNIGFTGTPIYLPSNGTSLSNQDQRVVITATEAHRYIACQAEAVDQYGGRFLTPLSSVVKIRNTAPNPFTSETAVAVENLGNFGQYTVTNSAIVRDKIKCLGEESATDRDEDFLTVLYDWRYRAFNRTTGVLEAAISLGVHQNRRELTLTSEYAHGELSCSTQVSDGFTVPGETEDGIFKANSLNSINILNTLPENLVAIPVTISQDTDTPAGYFALNDQIACSFYAFDRDSDPITLLTTEWFIEPLTSLPDEPLSYGEAEHFYTSTDEPIILSTITGSIEDQNLHVQLLQTTPSENHGRISCRVNISDGFGPPVTSDRTASISFFNKQPIGGFASTLNITGQPADPVRLIPANDTVNIYVGTTVSCNGETTDPDGDEVFYRTDIESYRFGVWVKAVTNNSDNTYTTQIADAHGKLRCRRYGRDGYSADVVSLDSTELVLTNSRPIVASDTLSFSVNEGSVGGGSIEAYDPDGDLLTATTSNCVSASGSPAINLGNPSFTLATETAPTAPSTSLYRFRPTITADYDVASNLLQTRQCQYSVVVFDSDLTVTRPGTITISNVDRSPVTSVSCPGTLSEISSSMFINYSNIDPDGDSMSVSASVSGGEADIIPLSHQPASSRYQIPGSYGLISHTGSFTGTTNKAWYRDVTVTFTATSGLAGNLKTSSSSCTFRINDADRPPLASVSCPGTKLETDSNIYMNYSYSDPDNDPISIAGVRSGNQGDSMTLVHQAASLRYQIAGSYDLISHSGTFTGSTTKTWYRDITVTFTATSTNNQVSSSSSCTFRINDVDRLPVILATPQTGTIVGGRATNSCSGTNGYTLSSNFLTSGSVNDPDGDTVTQAVGTHLTCAPGTRTFSDYFTSGPASCFRSEHYEYYYHNYTFIKPLTATANGRVTTGTTRHVCASVNRYEYSSCTNGFFRGYTNVVFVSGSPTCFSLADCENKMNAARYPNGGVCNTLN